MDVVAIGSWYQYHVANRASPNPAETQVKRVNIKHPWY
jgi:hypothetical protein